MAAWTAGPIAAVEEWLGLLPGAARPGPWTRCGEAGPAGDGELRLDLRDRPELVDLLEPPLVLAGREGPGRSTAFPVERFHLDDGVLVLSEPDGVSPGSHWVWSPAATSRAAVEDLLEGLRATDRAPLAEALAAGRLDGAPTWAGSPPSGLAGARAEAYRACRSPGLRVVWAPPDTGRTGVLARAAEDLVRGGERVLLVSTAAAAVDEVLLAVVASMRPGRGQVVRVGVPHRPGLDDLGLDALAARASADIDARRAMIARRLTDLAGTDDEIAELAARLDGYDPEGYRAAAARVAAAGRREELRTRYQDTLHAAELAYGRVVTARREHDRLGAEAASLAGAREALARLPELQAELRELDAREEDLRSEARAAPSRRRAKQAEEELAAFGPIAVARRRALWDEIIATRRATGGTTAAQLGRLDGAMARADRAATAAWLAFEPVESELRRLERAMEQANEVGAPTDADHALLERSERERLPALHERWTRLRAIRAQSAGDRSAHEDEHRRLAERSGSLRTDAEAEIIAAASLVGTTLARSRSAPVAAAEFDVVLVDRAEAATLAELLLVLGRAGQSAVLVGDFRLPGPALPDAVAAAEHPAVRTWVRTGCFGHLGIGTPADALAHDGCVALLEPRRGAALRRLLDDLDYRVLRAPADAPEDEGATEVVVVDASTLPDLAAVRGGPSGEPWWTAGLVLAPALARGAQPGVAVLSTSRTQAGLALAALRDRDLGVGCGPVTAFRGRVLDTAVLDQVGDGPDARAFALGVTRARRRLYVLVDGPALDAATGPLAALRHAVERGDARTWSAAALLGLDGSAPYRSDPDLAEVGDPLRRAVGALDVSAAADLRAELERGLGEARDSLWMWSPWLDTGAVVPLVAAAVGRGVRVRVFVRPDEDGAAADGLSEAGATVVHAHQGPRRLAVVDRRTVLLGSAVLPAGPRGPREALLVVEGRALADRLLVELAADALGEPRPCATCSDPMAVGGEGADARWGCRSCSAEVEPAAGR